MLDVGFSEILLTSAIALIVLGPEKLPKVARQVGNWMGRARVMARQLTEQLEREVNAEELLKQRMNGKKTTAHPPTSTPAAFDTTYIPNVVPPPRGPEPVTPVGSYSSDPSSAPIGADWQPAPPSTPPHE